MEILVAQPGIAEMLMQSHDGAVHLLPALPDTWKMERLGASVHVVVLKLFPLRWKDGKIESAVIKSTIGGNLRLRVHNALMVDGMTPVKAEGIILILCLESRKSVVRLLVRKLH